jgi:hypothetical protein
MRKDFTSSKRLAQFHAVACPTSESVGNVIILRPPVTSPTIIAIILCMLVLSHGIIILLLVMMTQT